VIIITIGARQKEGETRLDLVQKNVEIFKGIVPELVKYSPDAVIVVVTNPCDIMAWVTWKLSGLPKHRVFASGTMLDTSRFRHLLAERFNVAAHSVHGYISFLNSSATQTQNQIYFDCSALKLNNCRPIICDGGLFIMSTLCNRADHYILTLWFLFIFLSFSLFPRLISAAADWMSTILRHMVWP